MIGVHTPGVRVRAGRRQRRSGARSSASPTRWRSTTPCDLDDYRNPYWPAEYLIDAHRHRPAHQVRRGRLRDTEKLIRQLLTEADAGVALPAATTVQDATPLDEITPETYFSIKRVVNYAGEPRYAADRQEFTLAEEQKQDTFSLGGTWEVDFQGARAVSDDARVRLAYRSADVFVVLGGEGTVESTVTTDGRSTTTSIDVSGNPRLYPVLEGEDPTEGLVDLKVPAGVQVYTMTFG